MGTFPFSALVLACLTALLGLRFGLEAWVPTAEAASEAPSKDAGSVMAVPPKPEGLAAAPGAGSGEGQGTMLTPAICTTMIADLQDTCWQALARQTAAADPQEALRQCQKVAGEELRYECRADVSETLAPTHRDEAVALCKEIDSVKWRGQCNFGVGLALAETDPEWAIARCEDAEAFKSFCRHDVVGEISLVNVTAAVTICARNEGDPLTRKTCWHGPGKYLARRDMGEAAAFCRQADPQWQGLCFHGLGWGAAERDPDAALAGCAAFGEFADNCRHGVANELKRSDPQRETAICESLTNPEAKAKCLAFVTQ